MGLYFVVLFLTPFLLTLKYTELNFLRCIIGPFFIYIFHYVCIILAIVTTYDLWIRGTNEFHPLSFIRILFHMIGRLIRYIGRKIKYIAYKTTSN